MSRPVVSDTYPPRVDFTMTPLAYGLRAVPLLLKDMQFSEVVVRRRALNSLALYLTNPLNVQECLDRGVIRVLIARLSETDYLVRERTTACLQLISLQERGCEAICLEDALEILPCRIDDEEDLIRLNTYSIFLNLSKSVTGIFEMANYDLVSVFVEKLRKETLPAKKFLLDILHNVMEHEEVRQDVLKTPAVLYLTECIQNSDEDIKFASLVCIGDVTVETEGRTQANQTGTVELLVEMVLDEELGRPLVPATYALMMILVDIEARYRALKRSGYFMHRLLKLARHPSLEAAVNSLKIATLLAESPEGRAFFLSSFQAVEELKSIPDALVRKVLDTLIQVITWKP